MRAAQPGERWQVDLTIIRRLDGTLVYLHAVVDNFSRRVLAWRFHESFIPAVTAELLMEATHGIDENEPQLRVDGGIENYNNAVDRIVESGLLKRLAVGSPLG